MIPAKKPVRKLNVTEEENGSVTMKPKVDSSSKTAVQTKKLVRKLDMTEEENDRITKKPRVNGNPKPNPAVVPTKKPVRKLNVTEGETSVKTSKPQPNVIPNEALETFVILDKFEVNVSMCQSGKTFITINYIAAIEDRVVNILENYERDSLHIICAMNSKVNCAQFAARVNECIRKNAKHKPGSVVKISSDGEHHPNITEKHIPHYCDMKSVYNAINSASIEPTIDRPKVIVVCSNHSKFSDLEVLVEELSRIGPARNIYIYFDEIHSYIKSLRAFIERLHENQLVKKMIGLTATPESLFDVSSEKWRRIQIHKIKNIDYEHYVGCSDMNYAIIEPEKVDKKELSKTGYATYYAKQVLFLHHETILRNGSRVFIPADARTFTHEAIRKSVLEYNPEVVVIIINGNKRTLSVHKSGEEKVVKLDEVTVEASLKGRKSPEKTANNKEQKDESEISQKIGQAIKDHSLGNRCIVVTGYLALSQGTTLAHETVGNFTHAIIGHTKCTSFQLYQLFGRLAGRIKSWTKYTKTTVYCPGSVLREVQQMEDNAKVVAVLYNGKPISYKEYVNAHTRIDDANNMLYRETIDRNLKTKDIKGRLIYLTEEERKLSNLVESGQKGYEVRHMLVKHRLEEHRTLYPVFEEGQIVDDEDEEEEVYRAKPVCRR